MAEENQSVRLTQEHLDKYPQLVTKGWNVDEMLPQTILDECEHGVAPAAPAAAE